METLRAFLIAILTVVIGGLLLKAGEIPLARWVEGAPLRVTAITGPYNEIDDIKEGDKAPNELLGFRAFAKIEIENVSGEIAKNVRVSWGQDSLGFKSASVTRGIVHIQKQEWRIGRADPILVENLEPGERSEIRVYLNTYSPVDTLKHSTVYSSLGASSISVKGFDPDGTTPYEDSFLLALWNNITPLFLIVCCALAILCLVLGSQIEKYAKLLLDDEEYYLEEAQRFRANKKKFAIPHDKIGKMELSD